MASTPDVRLAGGRDERHRCSSASRGNDPSGASMVSVELGISVALIELFGGFVVGNAFSIDIPSWLSFIGGFAGIVLTFLAGAEVDVPQFRREWKASISIGLVSFFAPFVAVGAALLLRPRLEPPPGGDRGPRPLDDEPRRRVRGARRDRPQPRARRQADHVRDLRDRHRDGRRPDGPVRQPDDLDRSVRARLDCGDRRPAADRAVVLRPLRRPCDRARDQARLRSAVPAHVAGRPCELAGRAARVRAGARDERPLRPRTARSRNGCASSRLRS